MGRTIRKGNRQLAKTTNHYQNGLFIEKAVVVKCALKSTGRGS
jgi:hypothetical protein